jgi:hypothetical protein
VIGELAKLNAERELRIITRQLADVTRRADAATKGEEKAASSR